MKFLIMWSWEAKDTPKVRERFSKWTPPDYIKFIYPISTIIGANRSFCIAEVENETDIAKTTIGWTDIATFEYFPIIDSSEFMKLL